MSMDTYEQNLATWKAKHGICDKSGQELSAEDLMKAEDAKSTGKDFCWRCAQQFPIREMIVDTNPYIQDEERPHREDGYIPKKYRIRTCKACHDKEEADEE